MIKININNVWYVVKKIQGDWRFKEIGGAGANGWRFLRNACYSHPIIANAIIAHLAKM